MPAVFDPAAAAYDQWYQTPLGRLVDRLEKEALLKHLPRLEGRLILEVGCGTGNIALELAQRGARVVGLDLSAPMLAAAQRKGFRLRIPLALVRARGEALPFAPQPFDGALSILALDFIPQREEVLAEMVRVVRPGGLVVLALLNRFSFFTLKRRVRDWFRPTLWRQARFTSPAELRRLLMSQPELRDFRFSQAVYFPPFNSSRLTPFLMLLERLGRRLGLPVGAFMVASARKRGPGLGPPFSGGPNGIHEERPQKMAQI